MNVTEYEKKIFQQYFSYIMATSFSGGGSWSTQREPLTMGKQLVNFIIYSCESKYIIKLTIYAISS
jgi:hypothetical protein